MDLLQDLGTKKQPSSMKFLRMGLFHCLFCGKHVERGLRDGLKNKSCGCARRDLRATHGLTRGGKIDPLLVVWFGIKARCCNPKHSTFERYGGRGIVVCNEWLNNSQCFFDWARRSGWSKGFEVDRRDNNGPYSPDNCRIVTHLVNSRNRPSTKLSMPLAREVRSMYAAGGKTQREVGRVFGLALITVHRLVNNKIWEEGS